MSPYKITEEVKDKVRQRANYLCEYCHVSEKWQYVRFTIDHIIPQSYSGSNTLDNLALACFHCNRRKSDKLLVFDPETGDKVPLFNPRKESWNKHFIWSEDGLLIIGLTPVGRATIEELQFNREQVINIRAADIAVGRHPPKGDTKYSTGGVK